MKEAVGTILVAEDEATERIILGVAWEHARLSHQLVAVQDGRECVDYLSGLGAFADRTKHPLPALVMLDLKMPRMDGFEVLAWLRAQDGFKELPAVVLSSSSDDSDIAKARQLGAREYFIKPHSMADLVKILHELETRWARERLRDC